MLFSDIEGSTALLSRLGDRYGEALSAQRAILRAACRPSSAVTRWAPRTTASSSSSLRPLTRPELRGGAALPGRPQLARGCPLRVRMGLHSGEPARHEDGYIGLDLHRAARIAAAAHGGQVVVSDATRLLAASDSRPGFRCRDLGFHRLKDIEAPEHIFQLIAAGLPDRFPPLRSLGAATSFPAPMTPLVGRGVDLAARCATVARPKVRLVTLTGAGGVGKTRLALAAAASLDGVSARRLLRPAGAGPRRRGDVENHRRQPGRRRRRARRRA